MTETTTMAWPDIVTKPSFPTMDIKYDESTDKTDELRPVGTLIPYRSDVTINDMMRYGFMEPGQMTVWWKVTKHVVTGVSSDGDKTSMSEALELDHVDFTPGFYEFTPTGETRTVG